MKGTQNFWHISSKDELLKEAWKSDDEIMHLEQSALRDS
jgi:hypothetical protein